MSLATRALLLAASLAARSLAAQHADPRVTVTLDREDLAANTMVRGRLWIVNPDSTPVSWLSLRTTAPPGTVRFGVMRDTTCVPTRGNVHLGSLGPFTSAWRDICILSGRVVSEGDATLGFAVAYAWPAVGKVRAGTGVVLVEKKVGIGLLGNDSVAGVSLRLAALVIPGILFFLALRLLGVPFAARLGDGEVAALSVLFSVVLFAAAEAVSPAGAPEGISVVRFVYLCAAGTGAAVSLWLLLAGLRATRTRFLVEPEDSTPDVLYKALKTSEPRPLKRVWNRLRRARPGHEQVTVVLASGEQIKGAVLGETRDGRLAILARFVIAVQPGDPRLDDLQRLETEGRWAELAALARGDGGLPLTARQQIVQTAPDPTQVRYVERKDVARILRTDAPDPPIGVIAD